MRKEGRSVGGSPFASDHERALSREGKQHRCELEAAIWSSPSWLLWDVLTPATTQHLVLIMSGPLCVPSELPQPSHWILQWARLQPAPRGSWPLGERVNSPPISSAHTFLQKGPILGLDGKSPYPKETRPPWMTHPRGKPSPSIRLQPPGWSLFYLCLCPSRGTARLLEIDSPPTHASPADPRPPASGPVGLCFNCTRPSDLTLRAQTACASPQKLFLAAT